MPVQKGKPQVACAVQLLMAGMLLAWTWQNSQLLCFLTCAGNGLQEGLHSKNNRSRVQCAEEVGCIIEKEGPKVYAGAKASGALMMNCIMNTYLVSCMVSQCHLTWWHLRGVRMAFMVCQDVKTARIHGCFYCSINPHQRFCIPLETCSILCGVHGLTSFL